jgi:hypothetical protein
MSQRDYRLVIRLDIDKQSLTNLAEKINEVVQKAFGKIPKQAGGVGRVASVADGRTITLLTKIANEVSALNGNISRLIRVSRRIGVRKTESKKDEEEGEEGKDIFSIIGRGFRKGGGGGLVGLGTIGAVIGIFSAIGEKIIGLLEELVRRGTEFSGLFKATFKLLDVGISLLLKPIADIFGLLFRPLARLLLPVALALNKFLEPFIKEALKAIDRIFGKGEEPGGAKFFTPEGKPIGTVGEIDISKVSEDLRSKIKEKFEQTIDSVLMYIRLGAGPSILGTIAGLGQWVWDFIKEKGGPTILDVFANIVRWVEETFGGKVKPLFLGGVMGPIASLVSWISENWGNIKKTLGDAWDGFVKWVSDNFGGIGKAIGGAWGVFVKWVSDNFGNISGLVGDAWNRFIEWVKDNVGNISSILGRYWDGFVSWVRENFGAIARWIGEGWNKFVRFLTDVGSAISNILRPVWDSIVGFFTWLGEKIGQLSRGDFLGFLGMRGQFGLTVPRAGQYFLEAGELVLSRSDVMRLVSVLGSIGGGNTVNVTVTVTGPVYGVSDLEDRIRDVVEREVGNMLYDIQRRGVR